MRSIPSIPRVLSVVAGSVCLMTLMSGCLRPGEPGRRGREATPTKEFRGVFVTTAYNLDWPSRSGLYWRVQIDEMNAIVNRVKELNCNVILLQARAFSDRIHKSTNPRLREPWSAALNRRGYPDDDPSFTYDPLAEWIKACHEKNIYLHAWVNPFRTDHLIEYNRYTLPVVPSRDGQHMYLDPRSEQVHSYVIEVIRDLLDHEAAVTGRSISSNPGSAVNGLLFDHDMPDNPHSYALATRPSVRNLPNPRIRYLITTAAKRPRHPRDRMNKNLDDFMQAVAVETHKRPGVLFGFSPTYNDQRAKGWLKAGGFDYVIPEFYFRDQRRGEFENELRSWLDTVPPARDRRTQPMVIAGLYTTRVQTPDSSPLVPWPQPEPERWPPKVIEDQVDLTRSTESTRSKVKAGGQAHYDWNGLRSPEQGGPARSRNIGNRLKKGPYAEPARLPAIGRGGPH